MLFVFVALILAFWVVLVLAKRFAFGAFFISAGVFAMTDLAAPGEMFINPENPVSLRYITLNETPPVAMQDVPLGLRSRRDDLAELREHIKYELRRGNITAEKAITLNHLIDEIEREATVDVVVNPAVAQQALANLVQSQARLNETLADTIKLVKILDSVSSPDFAGTFIAAKIQVVRLRAEKAAVDGSIDEIRQSMKRPTAG
jgi:hypothetical protein